MNTLRNWKTTDNNANQGQGILHTVGWVPVMVKRANDESRSVGVLSELDDELITFDIRARIDPMESKEGTKRWLGLVETHLIPMMSKGDHWLAQQPDGRILEYLVKDINGDEIELVQV